ncbi:hypothetical protein SEA_PIONEER_78 [Mycobacterium phage Pioneer]|uniref:hypothetical protein n=1 Tax=Mycobacterium phage Pioneer TaxID=1698417 RepID=UPI0006BD08FE|nr:hypothetical protein AVV05_gp031 [Mycobacterium phage Pioneer]ALA07889.1 hypothetical protein SEA_PIONEER_78 [Mycobacterium phage Pioneer]AVI04166.1 hypothetical protein SEA_PHONNEGUT_78 [Mycobacterium phage Phonnegut]QGJ88728.1 hypothetical protein SEA_BEEMO_78 [Mycobacterium phage Beemo]
MYVDDVDDLEELEFLRDEAVNRLENDPGNEQASWDIEDIDERISELSSQVQEAV